MTDRPSGHLAVVTIGVAVMLSVLDGVMFNATLPTIAARLDAKPADAIWVVNAYQLAAAIVLLPLGKAADIYGHKRVYLGCITLFGLASVGCALAPSLVSLAAWRFVQGCGGAGIMGITNAMLRLVCPPERFGRGVARNSLLVALALAGGPGIASLVVTFASWRWLFAVNVPVTLLLLFIGLRALPGGTHKHDRYDLVAALLTMAMFGALLLSLDTGAHRASLLAPLALAAGAVACGILLGRRQRGHESPLLPLDMLRARRFGLSVATMFAASAAQLVAYVVLPFFFQRDLGRTQIETGLLFLPWPLALAVAAPMAGWLGDRLDSSRQCALGAGLFALGLTLLAALGAGATITAIGWRMALCGFGYGLFQPANSRTLIMSAPAARLGSASVMGASARVMGQATGAAVAALLLGGAAGGLAGALLVAAGFAAAAAGLSIFRGSQPLAARGSG